MSSDYVKLDKAPTLEITYPVCEACSESVEFDGDGFVCPICGTRWDPNAGDEPGMLYEEWSGEELDGPVVKVDDDTWSNPEVVRRVTALRQQSRDQLAAIFARSGGVS